MFSARVPAELSPNALASAVAARRLTGRPFDDLTETNPTRVGLDYPGAILDALSDPAGRSYAPEPLGLRAARDAVATDLARRGIVQTAERIVLTASTSEAYSWLFKLLCGPGDRVLVPRPSYPLFDHLASLENVTAAPYALQYHGRWSIDVEEIAAAVDSRTRALLVVSPNNPTGSYVRKAELDAVARLCADRGLALIGDEVFADYELLLGAQGPSVLDARGTLSFSLGGLSKSAGLPQVKLAWIAAGGPDALVEPALARLEVIADTYLSVSTPVQVAAAALMAQGAAVRAQIQQRIATNLQVLADAVRAHPALTLLAPEGGWSAVLQVPATRPEDELVLALLEEIDVLVHPGYFFDFEREAFLVISLLPAPGRFADAVLRLCQRLDPLGVH